MPGLTAAEISPIVSLINDARSASESSFKANLLVQIATLQILIKSGATTAEEAIKQIEETRLAFSKFFSGDDISKGINWAVGILRGEIPLHGSIIEQQMQKRARSSKA